MANNNDIQFPTYADLEGKVVFCTFQQNSKQKAKQT